MTPIATTANRRGDTITTGALTAGVTTIPVNSATDFQAKDAISIFGDSGSNFNQETQTIASISGSNIIIANALINSYDTGAAVTKMTRFITLDLNNIQWSINMDAYIAEDSAQNANTVAADLETMAFSGGTVKVVFNTDSSRDIQDAAVTSCSIIETAQDENYNYQVKLKLEITGKETSS